MSMTEDKISQILNSPESLEKISEFAKNLKQSGLMSKQPDKSNEDTPPDTHEKNEEVQDKKEESEPEAAETLGKSFEHPDLNKLIEGFKISPVFLKTIGKAAKGFNDNERRVLLLNAIKPFARGKSSGTLERAIFALKVARAVRLLMEDGG